MWFIGVEVEQETSVPPPKKNPGSAPVGEFDCVRLPNPIEVNRTIGVRLGSITERSVDYAGYNERFSSARPKLQF